jgi:hypothetical protein
MTDEPKDTIRRPPLRGLLKWSDVSNKCEFTKLLVFGASDYPFADCLNCGHEMADGDVAYQCQFEGSTFWLCSLSCCTVIVYCKGLREFLADRKE